MGRREERGAGVTADEDAPSPFLVTVSGQDGPGIASRLFAALAEQGIAMDDVEQVRVRGRLLLCVAADMEPREVETARAALDEWLGDAGVEATVEPLVEAETPQTPMQAQLCERHLVTLLGTGGRRGHARGRDGAYHALRRQHRADRPPGVVPVHFYEMLVADADLDALRRALAAEAARRHVDVTVQVAGLHRRAKHLIVMDADSTLLQCEVIDLLAERCGCGADVVAVTEAAMADELDFADALRARVRLLAGLTDADLVAVRESIPLAPGARTLVRTLKRLGYEIAVVSGGFTQVIEPLVRDLGIDHLAANVLVLEGGVLTGELSGELVDRAGKAAALARFADAAGVPLVRTSAVGDGANDIDMLAAAGLGIAFNAREVVRRATDTALSVPYLDAILFLLGISRAEVEQADRLEQEVVG
jgi:phosphoserine phosphatase